MMMHSYIIAVNTDPKFQLFFFPSDVKLCDSSHGIAPTEYGVVLIVGEWSFCEVVWVIHIVALWLLVYLYGDGGGTTSFIVTCVWNMDPEPCTCGPQWLLENIPWTANVFSQLPLLCRKIYSEQAFYVLVTCVMKYVLDWLVFHKISLPVVKMYIPEAVWNVPWSTFVYLLAGFRYGEYWIISFLR